MARGWQTHVTAVVVVLVVLAGASPATASQAEQGTLLVATGPRLVGPAWVGACPFVWATFEWAAGAGDSVGYRFVVDPTTRGHQFELRPDLPADVDIAFRGGGGRWFFERRSTSGEVGLVPAAAEEAMVCLVAGPPTGFTYQAS